MRSATRAASPGGCSALGASVDTAVWTAARGTAEGPWCVSGREPAGPCTGSPPGGMAAEPRVHPAFIPKFQPLYLG